MTTKDIAYAVCVRTATHWREIRADHARMRVSWAEVISTMNRTRRKARRIANANRVRAMYPEIWREFAHLPLARKRGGRIGAVRAAARLRRVPGLRPPVAVELRAFNPPGAPAYAHYFDPPFFAPEERPLTIADLPPMDDDPKRVTLEALQD